MDELDVEDPTVDTDAGVDTGTVVEVDSTEVNAPHVELDDVL